MDNGIVNYKNVSDFYEAKLKQFEPFAGKFLKFIPRSIPDYPSHGVDHSQNIIDLLNRFVEAWHIDLTEKETYLLYLGAWVHDIGCIIDRDNHNEKSADIINKTPFFLSFLEKDIITLLQYIVKAHSSSYSIETIPKDCLDVRLQLICSIFRLMDACEIESSKCPKEVYEFIKNSIDSKSNKYWIAHMNICGVTFKIPEIIVVVDDLDKSEILIKHLEKEVNSILDIFNDYKIPIPYVKKVCSTI